MKQLVALHVQAARNLGAALAKEGMLPARWKAEGEALAAQLADRKARGLVDARWEEPKKFLRDPTAASTLTAAEKAAQRQRLQAILIGAEEEKREKDQEREKKVGPGYNEREAKKREILARLAEATVAFKGQKEGHRGHQKRWMEGMGLEATEEREAKRKNEEERKQENEDEVEGEVEVIEAELPSLAERRAMVARLLKQ